MFDSLILLTGPAEQPVLTAALKGHRPDLGIIPIATREELLAIPAEVLPRARLVAFATAVIVPAAILDRLGYGACNFHPGPPEFPGFRPAQYAVYLGAREFGSTAHVMTERVDEGPIFDCLRFGVPPDATVMMLETLSFRHLALLFWRNAERLATSETLPPLLPLAWGDHKATRRKFLELCTIAPDIEPAELHRRAAAFGDGLFGIRLTMELHGMRFVYEPGAEPRADLALPGGR